eukprot:777136-Pelagomonas_calceolata.AAC.1
MKRTILQYRTGTLYNQKHAVHFKRSADLVCPLPGCHQLDSALQVLSGCQSHVISYMKTGHQNVAGRMITLAVSKSPWGSGLVNIDIGSDDRLAQHNLQIPVHASNRTIPSHLFLKKKRKKEKLRRQRKLSLHQLRKERHIDSKSHESSSPEDERGVNVDQVVFWQHAAPRHQCFDDECFLFSMARLVEA